MDFSISIVKFCDSLAGHRVLANQLLRSATSVGANLYEANYAQSRADFISKLQIALKECYESEYWLTLLFRTDILPEAEYRPLKNTCGTIRRLLISSINTAKANQNL